MSPFYSVVVLLVIHVSQCASEFRENLFDVYEDKKINQYSTLTTIDSIRSKEQCAAYCLERPACMSVSYNKRSHQCKISNKDPQNQLGVLAGDSEWMVLAKIDKPQGKWVTENNHSVFLSTIELSWMEAQSYCKSHNSTLIELRNKTVSDAMYMALRKDKKDSRFFWIGGKGLDVNFVWNSDSKPIDKELTFWVHGRQPDSGKHDGECIELVGTSNYSWNNIKCDNQNMFVCERPLQL